MKNIKAVLLHIFLTLLPFWAILLIPATTSAQSIFERMVMPGPLVKGHAKFQKQCKKCHRNFDKSSQATLCLACHKKVAQDLEKKRGFHGKRKDISATRCKHCHTDHKGRNMDIVGLDEETFNHDFSDFVLNGAHKTAQCSNCHKRGEKHRNASGQCVACHKKDDPHQGRLGKQCQTCHSEQSWRETKPYDHDKTKFPLRKSHKKIACKACHINEHYKDLPRQCVSCHKLQDVHNGQLGNRCEACHSPDKWKTVSFDHDRNTRFPLIGKHAETACKSCHKKGAGEIGNQSVSAMKAGRGQRLKMKKPRACIACHGKDDVHKKKLGRDCASCHNARGWRKDISFDHDLTRFPLIGLHGAVPCEECHATQSFKDTSRQCVSCHKDSYHKGRLGDQCATCHNPNSWQLWLFDHARQTGSKLVGAHAALDCHACHRIAGKKLKTSMQYCIRCHRKNDVHEGRFGTRCGRCHNQQSFKQLKTGR